LWQPSLLQRKQSDLRRLLAELGHKQEKPTPLYVDNESTITLSKTEKRIGRSKHMHRLHWLRHQVKRQQVELLPISTHEQCADFLTKITTVAKFHQFREAVGLQADTEELDLCLREGFSLCRAREHESPLSEDAANELRVGTVTHSTREDCVSTCIEMHGVPVTVLMLEKHDSR